MKFHPLHFSEKLNSSVFDTRMLEPVIMGFSNPGILLVTPLTVSRVPFRIEASCRGSFNRRGGVYHLQRAASDRVYFDVTHTQAACTSYILLSENVSMPSFCFLMHF